MNIHFIYYKNNIYILYKMLKKISSFLLINPFVNGLNFSSLLNNTNTDIITDDNQIKKSDRVNIIEYGNNNCNEDFERNEESIKLNICEYYLYGDVNVRITKINDDKVNLKLYDNNCNNLQLEGDLIIDKCYTVGGQSIKIEWDRDAEYFTIFIIIIIIISIIGCCICCFCCMYRKNTVVIKEVNNKEIYYKEGNNKEGNNKEGNYETV